MTQTQYYGTQLTKYVSGNINLPNVNDYSHIFTTIDYISVTPTIQTLDNIIALGVVPSYAIINDIQVLNQAFDTNDSPTLTTDLGLYTIASGGVMTVVSGAASLFHSASTLLQGANTTWTSLISSTSVTIPDRILPLWDLAGAESDPQSFYVIGLKINAAAATAATTAELSFKVSYIDNEKLNYTV